MTDSILEALERRRQLMSKDDSDPPDTADDSPHQKKSENSFLAAVLPVVRKIVRRGNGSSLRRPDALDLEQGIVLRLLRWRNKYRVKSRDMSESDWRSFAARAAYNEKNRHFSQAGASGAAASSSNLPLEAATEVASGKSIEGESKPEIESLVRYVWPEICEMSLRQRRSLLLHSEELVVYFLHSGINDEELARVLELSDEDWLEIKITLPLSDARIARLFGTDQTERTFESIVRSIKKARHEARARLRRLT